MRVLNVAEKNDAAKQIVRILSRGNFATRNGRSKYNKIYAFTSGGGVAWPPPGTDVIVTSVSGHLMNMNFPAEFNNWQAVNPAQLFDAPIVKSVTDSMMDIATTLEEEARHASHLILWTDCDREGENIGFEVMQLCLRSNPRLQCRRAQFSDLTPAAVNRAMANLQAPNQHVSDAVDCRQELDLRTGAAFTRLQTLFLRANLVEATTNSKVVSYGPCQFPTMGFVVERYKQMQSFVPESFWKIVVKHTKDGVLSDFAWERVRLFDRTACQALLDVCEDANQATVIKITRKPKSKWRPEPMDTVTLEKLASRKLRISAKRALAAAESLYTKGFISYPRTETTVFNPSIDLTPLVNQQQVDHRWGDFAADILQRGQPQPRNGRKTDEAHPPIHPTRYAAQTELQGEHASIYELVVRHFLATCSRNAEGQETLVNIDVGGEQFTGSGLVITDRGYLDVYPYDNWSNKTVGSYTEGETFVPSTIQMTEGNTSAPQLLTEADLIALMDKHGIGTDATHAEHIETIKDRQYVGLRDDRRLIPGFLGLGLVEGYDDMGYRMSKPNLRAELEADLKLICDGRRSKDDVLQQYITKYQQVFLESQRQVDKLLDALRKYFTGGGGGGRLAGGGLGGGDDNDDGGGGGPPQPPSSTNTTAVTPCPQCKSVLLVVRRTKNGDFFLGCPRCCLEIHFYIVLKIYPNCKAAFWLPKDSIESIVATEGMCVKCPPPTRKVTIKFKQGKRPPNFRSSLYTGCIICDSKLTDWHRSTLTVGGTSSTATTDTTPTPQCRCGQNSVRRTVRKENENKNKQFFCCSKPREQGCGFFQWVDYPSAV